MLSLEQGCTLRVIARSVQRAPSSPSRSWGIPAHFRSNNGSEFTAGHVRKCLHELGVKTLFIEPGSPWEHGYIESFNGKLRDELLNREVFYTLEEAKILVEKWGKEYDHSRASQDRTKWMRYEGLTPKAVCWLDAI